MHVLVISVIQLVTSFISAKDEYERSTENEITMYFVCCVTARPGINHIVSSLLICFTQFAYIFRTKKFFMNCAMKEVLSGKEQKKVKILLTLTVSVTCSRVITCSAILPVTKHTNTKKTLKNQRN